MDYTGTRRDGGEESVRSNFFKEICDAVITRVHPEVRFNPRTGNPDDPNPADVIRNWRLAGYYLATYFLPTKRRRAPIELEACLQGMRQRMEEYELEAGDDGLRPEIEVFDVDACEKLEAKAEKFLRLATHPNTGPDEARNAALGLVKMIGSSELTVLGFDRVRHFMFRFSQMKDLFDLIRQENPLLFLYGERYQSRQH